MKKIIFIFLLLFTSNIVLAQDPEILVQYFTNNENTGKKLPDVTIEIYKDGSKIETKITDSKGQTANSFLPVGHYYKFVFKKAGFVTKVAELDGRFDTPEDLNFETPVRMKFFLFESAEGVDFSFLEKEAMVKFEFTPIGTIDYDGDYTKSMQKKIVKLKKQIEDKKKELAAEEAKKAADQAKFDAYMDAGQKAENKSKLSSAVDQYKLALTIFKDDVTATSKLANVEKMLADQNKAAENEKAYNTKIAEAKSAFIGSQYQKAIDLYKEAKLLKPSETLPQTEIDKISKLLADQKAQKDKFDKLVADGDSEVSNKNYDNAITKFKEALTIVKNDPTVTNKLKNAENLKLEAENAAKAEAKKEADYQALMKEGANLFGTKNWVQAKEKYTGALALKENDPTATAQIKLIDAEIAKADADAKALKERQEKYTAKMAEAKTAFESKKYTSAISLYKAAQVIDDSKTEPQTEIQKIETILKDEADLNTKIEQLIKEGDVALNTKLYDDAITKYQSAYDLKNDQIVKTKIDNAVKLRDDQLANDKAAKEKEDNYNAAKKAADDFYTSSNWNEAKSKYKEALTFKEGDSYATERIADIDAKLLAEKAEKDKADKLDQDYKALIDAADALFTKENWNEAKNKYTKALGLKAGESHPTQRLVEIEEKLKVQEEKDKLDADYTALMTKAQSLFDAKSYLDSKAQFELASNLKKDEQAPKDKIKAINEILNAEKNAEQLEKEYQAFMTEGANAEPTSLTTALTAYKNALGKKPSDTAATSKISEIESLIAENKKAEEKQNKFNELVAQAKTALESNDLQEAKIKYTNADKLIPSDEIKAELKKIEDLIAQGQSEAKTKEDFDAAMVKAKSAFDAKDYQTAIDEYAKANSLMASADAVSKKKKAEDLLAEKLAKEKENEVYNSLIDEAEKLEANNQTKQALSKYKEAYIKRPMPAIDDKIKALQIKLDSEAKNELNDKAYQAKIAEADTKFKAKDWLQAIGFYEQAKTFTNDATYANTQIDLANAEISKAKKAKLKAEYDAVIAKADNFYQQGNIEKAIANYTKAKTYAISDNYPTDQLAKIAKEKADAIKNKGDAKKIEEAYKALVKAADSDRLGSNYTDALDKYEQALLQKPTDQYVIDKIKDVKIEIERQNKNNESKDAYNKLISDADAFFKAGNWKEAKAIYETAAIKNGTDPYPTSQIALCNDKMKNEGDAEANKAYQKIITVAQKNMDEGNYTKAINLFERAHGMNESDPIPPARIAEIKQIMDKDKVDADYKTLVDKADALFEKKDWENALPLYEKAYNQRNEKRIDDQIKLIRGQASKEDQGRYDKMIAKADEYFKSGTYENAKGLYKRAIKVFKNFDNAHPIAQLKAIEEILNPPTIVKTNTVNRGKPVVGMSESEMLQQLFEDQKVRKNNDVVDIQTKNKKTITNKTVWGEAELEATELIRQKNLETVGSFSETNVAAEVSRVNVEQVVLNETKLHNEKQHEESVYAEHAVFRQKRVVDNNIDEQQELFFSADVPRENFEKEVVRQTKEIQAKSTSESTQHTNTIFETETYVTNTARERVNNNINSDIPRQNMEIYLVDDKIRIVNANAKNSWAAEDQLMSTKSKVEVMANEQQQLFADSDIPRINMELVVLDAENRVNNKTLENNNKQRDINFETKVYVEHIQDVRDIESLENDIPRQKMELVVENDKTNIENAHFDSEVGQEISISNAKNQVDNDVIAQQEISVEKQDDNIENVKLVNNTKDKVKSTQHDLIVDNQNNSFKTKETIDEHNASKETFLNKGTTETINNQDEALDKINKAKKEQNSVSKENKTNLESNIDAINEVKKTKLETKKSYVKNQLGEEYPEGVTEEIYEVKDNDGLLLSYTVRRIVVIQGEGHVYEKTQSRFGVTYNKNSKSITKYQWQEDTGSVSLVKN